MKHVSKGIISIVSVVILAAVTLIGCSSPAPAPTQAPAAAPTKASAPAPTLAPAPATAPTQAPAPAATAAPAAASTQAPAAVQPLRPADLFGMAPSAPKKPYRLGITVPHYRDPFWVAVVYGEVDEAERWGAKIDGVYEAGSYTDLPKQIKQMEDLIQRKVDAILFSPVDYEGTAAVVEQAVKAGITVINGGNLTKSDKVALAVSNYDGDIGLAAADWLAEKLKGQGKVVLFGGPAGASWSVGRANAFKDRLKAKSPGIQVIAEKWTNVDRAEAQKVMEDWVQAFPQIDGVFATADLMGQGASIVLKQAGRKDKTFVAVAGMNEDTFKMVKEGGVDFAMPDLGVAIGRWSTQLAFKALNGESVKTEQKEGIALPKNIVYMQNPTYTKANIETANTALIWSPPGWTPPR